MQIENTDVQNSKTYYETCALHSRTPEHLNDWQNKKTSLSFIYFFLQVHVTLYRKKDIHIHKKKQSFPYKLQSKFLSLTSNLNKTRCTTSAVHKEVQTIYKKA